jgi:hypothetical protein
VRRIVSITLLLLVSFPLISPLFAASTAGSTLPACCRRAGKHHCVMPEMMGDPASGKGIHFSALRERCPYSPATVQAAASDLLLPQNHGVHLSIPHANLALRVAQEEAHYRISFDRTRQKRGPPFRFPSL